jgi:hypothetical protein
VEVAGGRCVAYGALVDPERTSEEPGTPAATDEPSRPARPRTAPGPRSASPAGSASTASTASAASAASASPTGVEAAAEPTRATRTRPAERRTTELREARPSADPRPTPEPRPGTEYRAGEVAGAEPTVPTNIYRARRPAVAVLLIIPAIAVGLLLIRALAISAFGDDPFNIGGVIASSAALAALPLLVAGLYGLVTGAAHGAEQFGFKVWARPPLAYLLVGLALVASAAMAIRAA